MTMGHSMKLLHRLFIKCAFVMKHKATDYMLNERLRKSTNTSRTKGKLRHEYMKVDLAIL